MVRWSAVAAIAVVLGAPSVANADSTEPIGWGTRVEPVGETDHLPPNWKPPAKKKKRVKKRAKPPVIHL